MILRFLLLLAACSSVAFAKTEVLVSIAPQKFLVEEVGGAHVEVTVVVPAGASSHTYEPTPKQVIAMRSADVWFRLGESFEERVYLPGVEVVDQRQGLELIGSSCCCCHGADPHTWLSPVMLKQQTRQIVAALSALDPEHAAEYRERGDRLKQQLTALHLEMAHLLEGAPETILVSHPAFGYLCRDYGLTQLSIEMEGREPTPRYLTDLIIQARALEVRTVFVQRQHGERGGKTVAKQLGADVVYLDPYKEDVISNLREIAKAFAR